MGRSGEEWERRSGEEWEEGLYALYHSLIGVLRGHAHLSLHRDRPVRPSSPETTCLSVYRPCSRARHAPTTSV